MLIMMSENAIYYPLRTFRKPSPHETLFKRKLRIFFCRSKFKLTYCYLYNAVQINNEDARRNKKKSQNDYVLKMNGPKGITKYHF